MVDWARRGRRPGVRRVKREYRSWSAPRFAVAATLPPLFRRPLMADEVPGQPWPGNAIVRTCTCWPDSNCRPGCVSSSTRVRPGAADVAGSLPGRRIGWPAWRNRPGPRSCGGCWPTTSPTWCARYRTEARDLELRASAGGPASSGRRRRLAGFLAAKRIVSQRAAHARRGAA